ncbi:LysR family transcriptional regulator [Clostridium luticellarii]|jgi:DNA-binding transcriptional LysR family regulator|uniref:HTH-type transcriptional regulator CysL n=1 Tax=Clostridium luticellarii TaxID=1691940 RepID=A0A2T0BMQ0_9CLOT|nr:LysR family transcriptional regulator [Clostridium luticellarii]MCI1945746.1 LysR family transcriptional regulator [Clostridium luticellarii]MCI1969084.1 LysR family transcriptional regulator [Clostridium luticellarii]MCI1996326.1 LysR family transcriptional regulator [Clostridium luticellarii]MCI2040653.1 LysR family transcriptional regulator [Clostridium luticellarii]PRR85158.1 HTH-type transcriptional regulator CysL [Clostridium luticellarii]
MTIRDLEIFVAVAEKGKIGTAAKKLYISQPTVSHAISQIEEEYHVKLFERLSRKLYITEVGKEFLNYARHILANFHEMEHYLHHASKQICIHIGASLTVGSFFLGNIISKFEEKNPRIRIRVYVDNSKNIIQKIIDGTLDIAIIEGFVNSKDIIATEVYQDEMVLICGKNHPFASKKSIHLSDLKDKDCVLREEGSGTRDFLINLTEGRGIPIVKKWICHSSDSIINVVAAGQGISMLSKSLLIHQDNVVQIPIEDFSLYRSFKIIYHKDKYISSALKKLIAAVIKLFNSAYKTQI